MHAWMHPRLYPNLQVDERTAEAESARERYLKRKRTAK